ncbi:protein of unknown function DUF333 [Desulfovibrio sp. X2]|uniref:putative hemolysin n=1 Tax=Desulfovibrio sp. X2 TaxID=941449 RepID=UPI000358E44E|nr:DUF333 domain-containing protein [Desulfovibrio sp. X2]EPR37522.1 protein of unknown function DUF333 [Desulfovibrio sp. X2]
MTRLRLHAARLVLLAAALCLAAACGAGQGTTAANTSAQTSGNTSGRTSAQTSAQTSARPAPQESPLGIANPASVYCAEHGGRLVIRTRGDGGQYGVCLFEDNRQCEEWAFFRGECPYGGRKITGYLDGTAEGEARALCAIRGGKLTGLGTSAATCTLPGRSACPAIDLWYGRCP